MEDEELSDSEEYEEEEQSDDEDMQDEFPANSTRLPTYNQQKDVVGYTIVDTEDLPRLKGLTLTQMVNPKGYISVFVIVDAKPLTLSHFIDGIPPVGFVKDHHNCNSLDNRKSNLSNVSRSQNAQNKTKLPNTSSSYSGVSWNKERQKWVGNASLNQEPFSLGSSDNEIDMAKMYDRFVLYYHGKFAKVNGVLTPEETNIAITTMPPISKQPSIYGKGISKEGNKFKIHWADVKKRRRHLLFDTLEEAIATRKHKIQKVWNQKVRRISKFPIERDENNIPIIKSNKTRGTSLNLKVDEKFYYQLNVFNWNCKPGKNPFSKIDGTLIKMPDMVLQLSGKVKKDKDTIDHIYHDHTDYREQSLRYISQSDQLRNRRKRKGCANSSQYIGVKRFNKRFQASIKIGDKTRHLGAFATEKEAAVAFNDAVDKHFPGSIKNVIV
jgi:hypothetical protein